MSRLLRAVVVGSVLGLCSASPAPDGTTSETTTDLPTYVDMIQSIQCINGSKIRLSFQNQYSFMDAWDWGLPRAVLINGDIESVSCDDYKPLGAGWLISNTANPDLYQQCRTGGQCTVEFNVVKADGTFKDLLVNYLSAQNMQVATTSVSVDTPTATVDGGTQPSAPGYTVDPWLAHQASQLLNDLTGGNPGAAAAGGAGDAPSGGGGYQRWQEIANEYEKQVQQMDDPNDATNSLKGADEEALEEQAEETAKDLLKSSLEANAEAFAGYFVTTFIAASLRAMLVRAAETAIGKTLVQQFVKMGIRELAAPVIGEVAAVGTGEIAGAGIAATIPIAGEIIGAAIIVFSEIEQIEDMLKTPDMNQDYQIGEFQLTGPNGKEYWVVEQGNTGAPPAYEAPTVPKQFKSPFFFVPPQMVFDPTNVGPDGALKNDPWPKVGWKTYDPQVTIASDSPIGTLGKGDHGNPDATTFPKVTDNPQNGNNNGGQQTQKGQDQGAQPQVTPGVSPQQDQPEPDQTQGQSQDPTTTTEGPSSYSSTSFSSSQSASTTQPKCLVPTQISNFITDMSKAFPAYAYSKTFKVNEGQSNEVTFKCQLACANCSLELNHKSVIDNLFGAGQIDGSVDLNMGLELTCSAGDNWKDAFKKKASQPILWGIPAYKKYKKIWQGSGPWCSDFALGSAMGLTFVPFKGKISFGFAAHKTVSMPIPAQGDTSAQNVQGMTSAWEVTVNPVKFSGFGLPSLALGVDLTADWGWGLSEDTPLLDAGFDLYPNFTMSFASRSVSLSEWSDLEAKECELPFQASAGEKPFVYVSAKGKDIWDMVLSPIAVQWSYTATATCFANYGNTATPTTTPLHVTSTILPTATTLPYVRSNSTFSTITRTPSDVASSTSSDGSDQITAWPWPDPTFVQTDDFKNLEVTTELVGTSIDVSALSRYITATAPAAVTTTAEVAISSKASDSVSSTSTSLSALPSVTGVFNTDESCGYGQGACAEGYNCLKVWPVEVAQSYMCGKPDLTDFEAVNIPTDFSPPTNNGVWACTSEAICYPTCGYLGALFDPTEWSCTNPIDNAVWQCLNDDGSAIISPAAANSATQCQMVCQPGFGMNDSGECIDILTDVKNCGQVGYDCSFGYDGYYASTPVCAMGMCVNLCPSGYTPFSNLCFDYNTDTFNCGSFGHQCNVANQEVCKNGACVQCYECYGTI